MSRRLHHLALGTTRVAELALFYRDVLGLAEIKRHPNDDGSLRSVWFDIGGALLMIERTRETTPRVEGIGAGLFLIAFCTTLDERNRLEQRLESAGIAIENRSEFTSYARDPDGNRIAFSHYSF